MSSARWLVVLCLGLSACAGAQATSGRAEVSRGVTMPTGPRARRQILYESGERFYAALSRGRPQLTLLDELGLRRLVDESSATRYSARRAGLALRLRVRRADFESFRSADFMGICGQGARERPAACSACASPRGRSSASWS